MAFNPVLSTATFVGLDVEPIVYEQNTQGYDRIMCCVELCRALCYNLVSGEIENLCNQTSVKERCKKVIEYIRGLQESSPKTYEQTAIERNREPYKKSSDVGDAAELINDKYYQTRRLIDMAEPILVKERFCTKKGVKPFKYATQSDIIDKMIFNSESTQISCIVTTLDGAYSSCIIVYKQNAILVDPCGYDLQYRLRCDRSNPCVVFAKYDRDIENIIAHMFGPQKTS